MLILGMILHFIATGLLVALVNWIGIISWRKTTLEHWTERARLLWPVRTTAGSAVYLASFLLLGLHQAMVPQTLAMGILNGLAGFSGGILGNYPLCRELFPEIVFGEWCRQMAADLMVKLGVYLPLIMAGICMPAHCGWGMLLLTLACVAFLVAVQWGLFLNLLRIMKIYQPAGDRLRRIVEEVSARMQVSVRGVWELKNVTANAFALISTQELIFTSRLLEIFPDEEIAAICAHELAHLTESKSVLWRRLLSQWMGIFPFIFIIPVFHACGPTGLAILYLGILSKSFLSSRLSQSMETRADSVAAQNQAADGVYALALERLYQANLMPAVNYGNSKTHPHLYDRLVAAGLSPGYPRPKIPERTTGIGHLLTVATVIVGGINLVLFFSRMNPGTN